MRRARLRASRRVDAILHHRERDRHLPLHRIGDADHRDLGDVRVRLHRFLDLARAEAMAGDVDHVVGAAEDEVVAVGVARGPVERRVDELAAETSRSRSCTKRSSSPHTVVMQPGGSGGTIASTPFSSAPASSPRRLRAAAARRSRRPGTTGCRTCAACPRRRAARTGSASRSRSASSCRRSATPSASATQRARRLVERLAGEEQVAQRATGRAACMYAGSCFFSTRIAVGELNIVVTLCSATIFHQIAGIGTDRQALVHDRRRCR